MNLHEKRAAAYKAANDLVEKAKSENRGFTEEEQAEFDGHIGEVKALDEQIAAAQKSQKMVAELAAAPARPIGLDNEDAKTGSLGERFVKSAAFKAFRESHPSGAGSGTPIRIEVKDIGGIEELGIGRKATITTETGQIATEREPGYYDQTPAEERFSFLDLITTGTTTAAYGEYAQIVSVTNNAAIVEEGELKPTSDVETALAESKAYTYADGFDITNQTLADDGALAAFMESRIKRHVLGVVEEKLLNGTGAGTEPEGVLNTTGTLAQAFDTDAVTTLARALDMFETSNEDSDPQAIVMNSKDIWDLRLLKDANGNYLLGNPLQQGPIPTPWGIPLVRSNKLAAGTALVGRFDSVNFLQLEALNVLAFNQHKDYAQRNMVYVRAEMRGRQLFYVPREVVVASIADEG